MIIVLIADEKAQYVATTPTLTVQLHASGRYSLEGVLLGVNDVEAENVLVLPDDTEISEEDPITDALRGAAMPLSMFYGLTKPQAEAEVFGLLMRGQIKDGEISDEELLLVAPALIEREWRAS